MLWLREFYRYLHTVGAYSGKIPVSRLDMMADSTQCIKTSVSDYTIMEIFRHLHRLESHYQLMYLINLFTGIRISDVCQLKTDCLYENEHGYFLAHDCQKMQDAGAIPISGELYGMIRERIGYARENGHEYLFPSARDKTKPCNSYTYRSSMQKVMEEWGIKNPDGTPYRFTTHAYRHTIATTLARMGMPSALIQLGILHHTEITMSRRYIEKDAGSQMQAMNEKGLNEKGCTEASIQPWDSPLPNGFCGMPARLRCEKLGACLGCGHFRTSLKFLGIHEKHLENLKSQIMYFKANGYAQNLAFAESEKARLELIINKLHELKGEDADENSFIKAGGTGSL